MNEVEALTLIANRVWWVAFWLALIAFSPGYTSDIRDTLIKIAEILREIARK